MEFYTEHNGNTTYSAKLYRLFVKNTKLLLKHPKLGIKTTVEGVRGLIVKDYILFYEYFHGDNGRGVGASHQTGWTGLIAKILQPRYTQFKMAKAQTESPK